VKRAVLGLAVAAVALSAVPASAAGPVGVGGTCGDHKIQVMCQRQPCQPEYPCNIEICPIWVGDCGLTR
jgi:hypothetical protein